MANIGGLNTLESETVTHTQDESLNLVISGIKMIKKIY